MSLLTRFCTKLNVHSTAQSQWALPPSTAHTHTHPHPGTHTLTKCPPLHPTWAALSFQVNDAGQLLHPVEQHIALLQCILVQRAACPWPAGLYHACHLCSCAHVFLCVCMCVCVARVCVCVCACARVCVVCACLHNARAPIQMHPRAS